jgi:cytochrome oxidase Cu insertion factor (SCO1/SenC/PrrC family)
MGPARIAAVLLAASLGAAAALTAAAHEPAAPAPALSPLSPVPALPPIRQAPEIALRDVDGRQVRLSAQRGRVVLVSFIYTRCTTACPLLVRRMAALQDRLQGADVRFFSVTVDPEHDDAAMLRAYARRFGADARRWSFLREEAPLLRPVLSAWDEWTRPEAGGEIDHPARLHLIDRRGRVREIYSLQFFDERQAEIDIRTLLREPS